MAKITNLVILSVAFSLALALPQSKTKGRQSVTSEDAQREFIGQWSKVAELYQTSAEMQQAVYHAKQYYLDMERMQRENTDPRPPAIDVPAHPFNCDPALGVSPVKPQSVHSLRPGDIDVVAALGDSITAGMGVAAENLLGAFTESRGEAWSVGGDHDLDSNVSTIPNMLRKFNPNIIGHSECDGSTSDFKQSWFNVAMSGARAVHLPSQVDDLLLKMKNDPRVLYAKDWKMITLFIGGNDFCSYCNDREGRTPAIFKAHIQETLDKLHDHVPRAFVNLVPMAHVGLIQNVSFNYANTSYPGDPDSPLYPNLCNLIHSFVCPCVLNDTTRAEVNRIQQDYFFAMKELTDSGRYDTKDDFTVVLQPHLKDQIGFLDPLTGMTDNRYFSPDCFHPNRRMHQVFAYFLYNTMLTPVGEKTYNGVIEDWPQYLCPTQENPFLFTNRNSGPGATTTTTTTLGPGVDSAWQPNVAMTTIVSLVVTAIVAARIDG